MNNKPNIYPMDLAPKIALVKPTDGKGATVQTQQTFRAIGQPGQMRVVMPAGSVQTSGTAQIIQTHLMPQAMLKQVDASGRTQITALPAATARTLAQTSITVTRSPTPNTFVQRGSATVTNVGPRGVLNTSIRATTPANISNLSSSFVRNNTNPPRAPSPAGTILSPGTTWMTSGSPPVQLIRASISQSPRARIVSQTTIPANSVAGSQMVGAGNTTISANIVSQAQQQQQQPQQQQQQIVTSVGPGGQQQQTFVATLATVLPQRQQTATLVYSNVTNPQQQFTSTQRVTMPMVGQRQVRPIQLNTTRLPATAGIRVSSSNISIRGPNIPVLAPTSSVLSTLPNNIQGRTTTVSASTLAATGLPAAARIIQVQQQPQGSGGNTTTGQVISTGRLAGNLMTLHPVIMNAGGAGGGNRAATTAKVQPSLTITHVGKLATAAGNSVVQPQAALTTANIGQTTTIGQQIGHSTAAASSPLGIAVTGSSVQQQQQQQQHQIAQIVGINQQGGVNVGHGHQIQLIGSQNIPVSGTVVPLTITSRGAIGSSSTATGISQIVRNINVPSAASVVVGGGGGGGGGSTTNVLPVAKVMPQSNDIQSHHQQQHHHHQVPVSTNISQQQNVFLHTRSPNPVVSIATSNVVSSTGNTSSTTYLPTSAAFFYEPIATTGSGGGGAVLSLSSTSATSQTNQNNNNNNSSSNIVSQQSMSGVSGLTTSVSYAPQTSSFAVVPSSARNINQQLQGMIPLSASVTSQPVTGAAVAAQLQSVPVRFNPQLIVDGGSAQQPQSSSASHPIITMQTQPNSVANNTTTTQQQQQQQHQQHQQQQQQQQHHQSHSGPQTSTHMVIPVSTNKLTATTVTTSPRPSILRKRDIEGAPLTKSAVKNLGPTLLQMSGPTESSSNSGAGNNNHNVGSSGGTAGGGIMLTEKDRCRVPSPHSRPGSSDGSTTVSVPSSPNMDQQDEHEEMQHQHHQQHQQQHQNQLQQMKHNRIPEMAFKTVDEMYRRGGDQLPLPTAVQHPQPSAIPAHFQQQNSTSSSSNGHHDEVPPRKKPRKQQINEAVPTKKFQAPPETGSYSPDASKTATPHHVRSNKENSKPPQIYIKKPRTCTLLDSYKQNWKTASNHFQRYTDVKPRDERSTTVMDLANQTCVLQKINGWKIFHLTSQMEDLSELESQVYDKLSTMLQFMEAHNQSTDVDRVNDLIKGNMQRSKIVTEGINDARTQILKIFDHKSHVSDIVQRCASKRNFKKREKTL